MEHGFTAHAKNGPIWAWFTWLSRWWGPQTTAQVVVGWLEKSNYEGWLVDMQCAYRVTLPQQGCSEDNARHVGMPSSCLVFLWQSHFVQSGRKMLMMALKANIMGIYNRESPRIRRIEKKEYKTPDYHAAQSCKQKNPEPRPRRERVSKRFRTLFFRFAQSKFYPETLIFVS